MSRTIFLLLLYVLTEKTFSQQQRVIHVVNIPSAPILNPGSFKTARLAEGTDSPGEMGVYLFSKDSTIELKKKWVGTFGQEHMPVEGGLAFKNGDSFYGNLTGGVNALYYDKGTYTSKNGGYSYTGLFDDTYSDAVVKFKNGDKYTGHALYNRYSDKGVYSFADGELIIARWDNNRPEEGAIYIPGKDTIRGKFINDGFTSIFTSNDRAFSRRYLNELCIKDNERPQKGSSIASGMGEKNNTPNNRSAELDSVCITGNCRTGKGRMLYRDSSYYEGSFLNGQRNGQGILEDRYEYYNGSWKANALDGQGIYIRKRNGYRRPIDTATYQSGNFIAGALVAGIDHQSDNLYYKGEFKNGKLNGKGVYNAAGMIYSGNFKDGQLFGSGSLSNEGGFYMYGDNWTDNDHMARGKFHNSSMHPGDTVMVMFEKGDFFTDERLEKKKAADALAIERAAAKSRPSVYKDYVFISDCTDSRRHSFKCVATISADISKHSFDEITNKAGNAFSRNGWNCGGSKYLGLKEDVHITGTPGRDYVVIGDRITDW
jgi:hypothetical protein